jgi:hypothetical protein
MPAAYFMAWEPTRRRWWKQYRNTRHVVSCRQLDAPETKEGSYQAANAWWVARKAEIDGKLPPHPHARILRILAQRIAWAQAHGLEEQVASIREEYAKAEADKAGVSYGRQAGPLDVPSLVVDLTTDAIWDDRISRDQVSPADPDRSVGHQSGLWLAELKGRVEAGQFGAGEYQGQTYYSRHFVAHFGKETSIDAIDEELWAGFHRYLIAEINRGRWTAVYAKKLHRSARNFVEHLASLKRITAPENLHDRRMRFSIPAQEVEVFTLAEVRGLMEGARDQVRVLILLALNCGMTQVDISDLHPGEVDWSRGRLKRKRSKTAGQKNVPEVEYPLWPETLELLKALKSSDAEHVLVTKSGRPWVDRKTRNTDSVRTEFDKLKARLPFKHLRKTSATVLGSHPEYRAYAQYFLGHAPETVADTHYIRPSQERFDLALLWLREKLILLASDLVAMPNSLEPHS